MSQADWDAPLPADDGTGEEELYNPITYEQEVPGAWAEAPAAPEAEAPGGPEPDAWNPGRAGGDVPAAGTDADGSEPVPSRWAPAGWLPVQQAMPVRPAPTFTPSAPAGSQQEPSSGEPPAAYGQAPAYGQPLPYEGTPPAAYGQPPAYGAPPAAVRPAGRAPGAAWPDESWPPRRQPKSRPPRWILAAAAAVIVAAAVAGTALALAGRTARPAAARNPGGAGHGRARADAGPPPALAPPITPAAARAVLSRYTAANNTANARMDPRLLGATETGSSLALDRAQYKQQRAEGAPPFTAFAPASQQFDIPLEPAAYPHWFAVRVFNRALDGKRQGLGTDYLLFRQSAAGAPWKVETEPYPLGGASTPPVARDASGYATAVASGAPGLAVSPSGLAQETADSQDGHGPVHVPGNLADALAVKYWRARLPGGTRISDTHTATGYPVAGLRTADGGALLFYTDAADVTFTAPPGTTFTMTVPGFYKGHKARHRARLRFLEELATYDPPGSAGGAPRVVADFCGVQKRR